ncbi:MAG TPA: glycosyltransferase [Acidimicrobiia bacterium]|nr:glycosyltransferase [Acidimicrobiia bacterium]
MTRVLWITKGLGPGGAERLLVEHAAAGDQDRFRYEAAYLLPWKDHLVPELAERGVASRCLNVRNELDPRWLARLDRLLRDGGFDVVHLHSPSVAAGARVLVKARPASRRPRIVYTEHNRWPSYHPVTRAANRGTYRLNDAVLAVSDDVRDSVSPSLRSRVEVLVHGIDVPTVRAARTRRAEIRAELGVAPGTVLAVTIANLRAKKDYPGLLTAARLVLDRGVPVRFVAAGQGPDETDIRRRHRELGLGDEFRLLGYRADATDLVAAADVYVLASRHEGLPVSVMEALTLGVPVVATNVGGLREVVTDGSDGLLVEPGHPRALADAIGRVATDAELRARLGGNADRDCARFSSARAVRRIEEIYASFE